MRELGEPVPIRPARWVTLVLGLVAIALVPWTLYLTFTLPSRHVTLHYDLAWVGFDIALAAALAATGWAVASRSEWAPAAAAVAATLLVCDAWFDNVLANSREEHIEAAVEAVLIEIPLALFCVWLALHCEQTVDAVLDAVRRRRR